VPVLIEILHRGALHCTASSNIICSKLRLTNFYIFEQEEVSLPQNCEFLLKFISMWAFYGLNNLADIAFQLLYCVCSRNLTRNASRPILHASILEGFRIILCVKKYKHTSRDLTSRLGV